MAEDENMSDAQEQNEEEQPLEPENPDDDIPDDDEVNNAGRPNTSRVAETKGSFAANIGDGFGWTKRDADWKNEQYFFEEILRRRRFFDDDNLGGKHWKEFEKKYLEKERENPRNRGVRLTLDRVTEALSLNGPEFYTTDDPRIDSPEKEKEFWHTRFMITCYIDNRDVEDGVFPRRSESSHIHSGDFSRLWRVFLKRRDLWFREHPPRKTNSQKNGKKGMEKMKQSKPRGAKKSTTEQTKTDGLDQMVVTKIPDSPGEPIAKRFLNISTKAWSAMVAEIGHKFHLDGAIEWESYRLVVNESWRAIEVRARKSLEQAKGTELRAQAPTMAPEHWSMIKQWARRTNVPIVVSLIQKQAGDDEEEASNPVVIASTQNCD